VANDDDAAASDEFKEGRWHWWFSRVVLPAVAIAAAVYVGIIHPRSSTGTASTPTPTPSSNDSLRGDPDVSKNFALQVRNPTDDRYAQEVQVTGANDFYMRGQYKNIGSSDSAIIMSIIMPPELAPDLSDVMIRDVNNPNPNGAVIDASSITRTPNGFDVNIGRFAPGSNAFVAATVSLRDASSLPCGVNTFTLRATYTDTTRNSADASDEARAIYSLKKCR